MNYKLEVLTAIEQLKAVFEATTESEHISIIKQAGQALAANITQNPEVDKFSAAAALYELVLIDTGAFFSLVEEGTATSMKAAQTFIAESPKMLAQIYAAITLLS